MVWFSGLLILPVSLFGIIPLRHLYILTNELCSASKFAMEGWTEAVAKELPHDWNSKSSFLIVEEQIPEQ